MKLCIHLPKDQLGRHISGQLIRSATSVAANYRASCNALSVPVIISKMSIAIEEADESQFWIDFALEEKIVEDGKEAGLIIEEAKEIVLILTKARQTLQKKMT